MCESWDYLLSAAHRKPSTGIIISLIISGKKLFAFSRPFRHFQGSTNCKWTFRLFDKPDWPNGFGNYPYFGEEGEVSALLENANDGDLNFRFVGTTGTFTMAVDLYNLKVDMSQ